MNVFFISESIPEWSGGINCYLRSGGRPEALGHHGLPAAFYGGPRRVKILPFPRQKILEMGTGSVYQAAVSEESGSEACSADIVAGLGRHACAVLRAEGRAGNLKRARIAPAAGEKPLF